ncbi:MAG: hypothetical protein IIW66_06555 [Bacteroidales bacterium]|jgi:uncharacterized protein YktA (UPF0223 family)|nr:hypothetical protein [Bacteroidales bacterium]
MSKCIGDCARCELPVDKYACCAYQTFKNVLELKSRVKALEEQINKESEVVQYKTIDDLDGCETS